MRGFPPPRSPHLFALPSSHSQHRGSHSATPSPLLALDPLSSPPSLLCTPPSSALCTWRRPSLLAPIRIVAICTQGFSLQAPLSSVSTHDPHSSVAVCRASTRQLHGCMDAWRNTACRTQCSFIASRTPCTLKQVPLMLKAVSRSRSSWQSSAVPGLKLKQPKWWRERTPVNMAVSLTLTPGPGQAHRRFHSQE